MDGPYYVDSRQPFISGDVASVTLASTAKALVPVANLPILGGNYFGVVGKAMRIRIFGRITVSTTPGNLTMGIYYGTGADANGVNVVSSAATAMTASQTNLSWCMEAIIRCRTTGATGTLFGTGYLLFNEGIITSRMMMPASAPAASAACDLTAALVLSPQAIQSGTPVGSIQVHDVLYEALN